MENNGEIDITDFEKKVDDVKTELADAEDEPMVKKLKRELQCPVCYQIPTSIPIPACTMGHIVLSHALYS